MESRKKSNPKDTPAPDHIDARVIIFGRTGSGKSYLGNKIAGDLEIFKEGETLNSETFAAASTFIKTPDGLILEIIDTPGFGDTKKADSTILSNIVQFVISINSGFNMALYCLPATEMRFDSYHTEELNLIELILGGETLEHISFVITQQDRLNTKDAEEAVKKWKNELPTMLEKFVKKKKPNIIISDPPKMKSFFKEFYSILENSDIFIPKIASGYDPKDPEGSVKKIMQSDEMKEIISHFEKLLEQERIAKEKINADLEKQAKDNDILKKQNEERAREISDLKNRQMMLEEESRKIQREREEDNRRFKQELEESQRKYEREREEDKRKHEQALSQMKSSKTEDSDMSSSILMMAVLGQLLTNRSQPMVISSPGGPFGGGMPFHGGGGGGMDFAPMLDMGAGMFGPSYGSMGMEGSGSGGRIPKSSGGSQNLIYRKDGVTLDKRYAVNRQAMGLPYGKGSRGGQKK